MHPHSKHFSPSALLLLLVCITLILVGTLFQPCLSTDDSAFPANGEGTTNGDKSLENGDDIKGGDKQTSTDLSESSDNGGEEMGSDDKRNETFDRLYAEGIKAYSDHLWYSCAFKIESALADHKVYTRSLADCRLECNEGTRLTKISNISSNVQEFAKFFSLLKVADCFRRCKEDLVGKRNPVSAEMEQAFEERSPYLYLQFCYFKLDKYKKAASASYTYYLSHPDDEETKRNIHYYRDTLKIPQSDFVDLEMTPFKEHYIRGSLAYRDKEWKGVIEHMEMSLAQFLKDMSKCYTDCYGSVKVTGKDFILDVADAVTRVMMCQVDCETKMSVVYSESIPNIVQDILHHLQYAYYTVENYDNCAKAIASFLLLNESHEVMQDNKESLKNLLTLSEDKFVPREEIEIYGKQRKDMTDTLDFITKNYKWPEGIQVDEAIEYEDMMAELNDEPDDWMTRYERLGMHVVAKASDLHREERFVTDGIMKAEQCDVLKSLIEEVSYGGKNVKFFNFRTAQKILKATPDEESEGSIRLLIRAAEVVRHYIQRYSQQETTYFLRHSSIICHRPVEENEEPKDCYPQEDGLCIPFEEMSYQLSPGLYTTITYLTDEGEDGDFYFLNDEKEKDGSFGVKCGRTVGFNSGDRHSLNMPHTKERCAFVIQYTMEMNDDDREFAKTIILLQNIDLLRREKLNISNEEIMKSFKDKGVKVVKSGSELKGKERFLADGVATDQQCNSLKNMVQKFGLEGDGYEGRKSPHTSNEMFAGLSLTQVTESAALAGDGYDHLNKKPSLISPHTKNEMFMGINLYRASKLFHSKMISSVAFQTFLDLSENSRMFVEKYFNLTSPLYFDYTHLVCRTARDDSNMDRNDLSHPVHADNCVLQPDGSCSKEFPAFTQRDYSAILYINDDFKGGEFFFAHSNKSEQVSVRPKCGRLVGFNAGEFHGVRAVLSGQRCALALWFTHDPNFKELAHVHARKVLKSMEHEVEIPKVQVREDL